MLWKTLMWAILNVVLCLFWWWFSTRMRGG